MRLIASTFLVPLVFIEVALAHPPVSVVADSRGWVYFSDLANVWVLRADGTKEVVVPNVHTHELWMSPDDILYGEDVTNIGERYRHRVWKRYPDGRIENEIGWRNGHPTGFYDYSFARDGRGRSFVLNRRSMSLDIVAGGERVSSVGYDTAMGYPHWVTVDAAGRVYVALGGNVLRYDPGHRGMSLLAEGLVTRTEPFMFVHDRHALMGMWTGKEPGVFVAVYSGQCVVFVSDDGTLRTLHTSVGRWSPVGGMTADDGSLWVQEWSSGNETRLVRVSPDGSTAYF